jgi:hypothetical protein
MQGANFMRTVGAAILGLFLGLLACIVITDIGAQVVLRGEGPPAMGSAGLIIPVGGLVGAVAAVLIEQRLRNRGRQ